MIAYAICKSRHLKCICLLFRSATSVISHLISYANAPLNHGVERGICKLFFTRFWRLTRRPLCLDKGGARTREGTSGLLECKHYQVRVYSSTGFFQKDKITQPIAEPTSRATAYITGLPMMGMTQKPP